MTIKMIKTNKLFITTLEVIPTVKHLIKTIAVKVMRPNKTSLLSQNQVISIPQITRLAVTLMMKDQSTAGKINKATLMRLYRQKIMKANIIKSIDGKTIVDALTKLKIGLIRRIMFINATDGKTIKEKLMKQFMLPKATVKLYQSTLLRIKREKLEK